MSRRQQQASLVKELQHRVQLTPLKHGDDASDAAGVGCSPLASTLPPLTSEAEQARIEETIRNEEPQCADPQNVVVQSSSAQPVEAICSSVVVASPASTATIAPDELPPVSPIIPQSNKVAVGKEGRESVTANAPIVNPTTATCSPRSARKNVRLPVHGPEGATGASPRRVSVQIIPSPKLKEGSGRAGSLPSAADAQRLRDMQDSLAAETLRREELEGMVRELSATVHRQARELEAERATVRGLREELALRAHNAAGQRMASSVRVPSPNRVPTKVPPSSSRQMSASAPRNGSPAARNSSPSITRPTLSSARKSPIPPQRTSSPGSVVSSAGGQRPARTMSPTAARQHLAASTFLQSTSSSAARTATSGRPMGGAQPARPKLNGATASYGMPSGSHPSTADSARRATTTVVMQNGVVLTNPSGSLSAPRKITPARERVDAALERLVNGRSRATARK